ncbi:MAG: bifunctional adenosylcobinamide kinase/adenosylcobinamide-phosphate guanylyltransferase [Burkholderiaceae bacterium]
MDERAGATTSHLILGGQKSGKSRYAEAVARAWVARGSGRRAVLIATAQGGDAEMRERIARHRSDRAQPGRDLQTVEEPLELAACILAHSRSDAVLLVDCVTLWLTNLLMPPGANPDGARAAAQRADAAQEALLQAVAGAPGPLVLVANEMGSGVVPLGADVRAFVDRAGLLNQRLAQVCGRVSLVAAGLPLVLKGTP